MTTIVTRSGKGSPLTHTEVDTNFVNLNTAKLETAAIPLGTLGAPSISFLSYSTTGIYSPAGDELGVSMLGSDKIRIKSTGEIIINATASRTTLSTTPRLQIEGSSSSNQCSMSLTGAGAGGTLFPRLHLSKARSSVNAIVLEDDILGFISFNGGDGSSLVNAGFIKAEVDGTPSAGIVPGRLVFATVDTAGGSGERMIIKNNGNVSIDGTTFNVDAVNNRVGVGTSSPEGPLHVMAAGSTDGQIIQRWGYTVVDQGTYELTLKTGVSSGIVKYNFSMLNNGTSYNDVLVLDRGKVGIGSTSPSQKLEIGGAGRSTVVVGSTDSYAELSLVGATTENYITSDDALAFFINNAERLRIDTSGRLLVGTTSADGLISNISPVIAGAFKSHSGSVSIAPSTTVTIFTIPASNGEGAYTVTAIYVSSNNVATFSAYAVILYDGSATNAYRALGYDGGLLSITVSGRDVQLTTGATYTQGIKWSFVKQAVA